MADSAKSDASAVKRPRLGATLTTSARPALPATMHTSGVRRNSSQMDESQNIFNYFAIVKKHSGGVEVNFGAKMKKSAQARRQWSSNFSINRPGVHDPNDEGKGMKVQKKSRNLSCSKHQCKLRCPQRSCCLLVQIWQGSSLPSVDSPQRTGKFPHNGPKAEFSPCCLIRRFLTVKPTTASLLTNALRIYRNCVRSKPCPNLLTPSCKRRKMDLSQ